MKYILSIFLVVSITGCVGRDGTGSYSRGDATHDFEVQEFKYKGMTCLKFMIDGWGERSAGYTCNWDEWTPEQ